MSPKEFEFFFSLLEHTSKEMYARGLVDGKAGKDQSDQSFAIGRNNRLLIKTNLKKFVEKR